VLQQAGRPNYPVNTVLSSTGRRRLGPHHGRRRPDARNRSGRNRMCRAVLMGMLISQGELMTLAVGCLTSAA
jgi:hypothetical protein